MIYKVVSKIHIIAYVLLIMNATSQLVVAKDKRQLMAENNSYKVTAQIELNQIVVNVSGKTITTNIEHKQEIIADSYQFNMYFISDNSFLIETELGVGKVVYIGVIVDANTLKINGFRVARFLLSPDKSQMIYSDWVTPLEGPTNLTSVDLRALVKDQIKEKVIFSTERFMEVDADLIISPDDILWGGNGNVYFVCKKKTDMTKHYLFQHNVIRDATKFIQKIEHKPNTVLKSFKWDEKKKSIEFDYESRKEKVKSTLSIPVIDHD